MLRRRTMLGLGGGTALAVIAAMAVPALAVPAPQTVTWSPTTTITTTTAAPSALATTNGDGPITYSVTDAGATGCTVNATSAALTFTGAGACEITATAAATAAYAEGTAVVTFTVNKANPTLDWADQTVLLTDSPWTPDATSDSSGAITYTVLAPGTANCSFAAGQLTFTAVGECDVQADIAPTGKFNDGTATATISVRNEQTVTWDPETAVTTATTEPSKLATTDGDGTITYAVTDAGTTGCTVNATTGALTFAAFGNCEITATAAQTATYSEATEIVTFVVSRAGTTITWNPSLTILATATGPSSLATTNSDGALTYAVTDDLYSGCTVNATSGAMTFVTSGICEVTATVARTNKFAGATKTVTFNVAKAVPVIRWGNATVQLNQSPWSPNPAATTTSGGAITYTVKDEGTAICSWDASSRRLVFVQSGTCTVTAASASTPKFAFGSRDAVITVGKASPTLNWSDQKVSLTQSPWTPNATTSGDGKITYAVVDPGTAKCVWDEPTRKLSFTAVGQCQVSATTAATDKFGSTSKTAKITVTGDPVAGALVSGPDMDAAELDVGKASAQVGGKNVNVRPRANAKGNAVLLANSGWSVTVGATTSRGGKLPLGADGHVVLREGSKTAISATGLEPGTSMTVYLLSGPVTLRVATVAADGSASVQPAIPLSVAPGDEVVQVKAVVKGGASLIVSLGVEVEPNDALSVKRVSGAVDFPATGSQLAKPENAKLDTLAAKVPAGAKRTTVTVIAYTAPGAANTDLAESRANAVAADLKKQGVKGTYTVTTSENAGLAATNRVSIKIAFQEP